MDCARNIITANFSGGGTSATTAPLWQWDYGQALCITGIDDLPAAFEVHFSTNRTGGVSTTAVGADGQVTIPNGLLTIGKNINAWIYLSDAQGEGETEYSITIPVKARPMPETYDAEVTGEFDDVVRQVSEYAETAQTAADNAGASATAAAASADSAAASASAAETAKTAAQTAQGKAEDAQAAAETAAQTATEKAQQTARDAAQAAQSKADAESAAQSAEAAQTGAESAKTDAETAAQGAAASASAASASATSAGQSATSAGQSATAAAGSATAAGNAAQTTTTKAAEASASADAAAASETAAQTAQTAAETAATNAGQSASTATTKAAEAAQSASNAAASETAAEAAATRAEQAAASLVVDDALSDTSTNPVQNKVITGELTNVKNAIDALKITDTASGAIASFPDGAAMPMESLTVELEPIQDLHGQDSPYPAGGGKNLFDEDTVYAAYKQTDGSFICTGAQSNFTRIAIPEKYIGQVMTFSAIMRIPEDSVITNVRAAAKINGVTKNSNTFVNDGTYALSSVTFTPETAEDYVFISYGSNGSGNMQFKDVQLEIGSEATDFAPYSNVCPISGRTEVKVVRTGKNLFDVSQMHLNKSYDGTDRTGRSVGTFKLPAGDYTIKLNDTSVFSEMTVAKCKKPYPFASHTAGGLSGMLNIQTSSSHAVTYTIDGTYQYIYVLAIKSTTATEADFANAKLQLELGSTATAYEPYNGQSVTVQLGQTVYGGTLDVTTGVLTVDRVKITLDGTQNISVANWKPQTNAVGWLYPYTLTNSFIGGGTVKQNVICDRLPTIAYNSMPSINGNGIALANDLPYGIAIMQTDTTLTTKAAINAYLSQNPLEVVYELAEPIEITGLTTASLSTLRGDNTVWSDGDSVEVEYVCDPKLYIDKKITAAVAALA